MPDTLKRRGAHLARDRFSILPRQIEAHEDVMTVPMAQLRDMHQAGRLGVHVREAISDRLHQNGIGHYPEQLPSSGNALVRLYRQGSSVERVINAVNDIDDNEALRQLAH